MRSAFDANVSRAKPLVAAPLVAAPAEPAATDKADSSGTPPQPATPRPTGPGLNPKAKQKAVAALRQVQSEATAVEAKTKLTDTPSPLANMVDRKGASHNRVEIRFFPHPPPTQVSAVEPATSTLAGRLAAPLTDVLREGRERVQHLRDRLQVGRQLVSEETDPQKAAEATRRVLSDFQDRTQALLEERDSLQTTVASLKGELETLQASLADKNKAQADAETLAVERVQLAADVMAEVELLAEERDATLLRLADLKALDEQQSHALIEAEAALAARDEALQLAQAREAKLQTALQGRTREIEELSAYLFERTAERDNLLQRIQKLESDSDALADSRSALREIKRLVEQSRL